MNLGTLVWGERRGGRLGMLEMFAQARDPVAELGQRSLIAVQQDFLASR